MIGFTTDFTIEEINLMCIYGTDSRARLLADLHKSLPHVDEPEMLELMQTVIVKLQKINDETFSRIIFSQTDEFYEQEG